MYQSSSHPGLLKPLLLLVLTALSPSLYANSFSELKGYWQCQEAGVGYSLEFTTASQLLYNGEATNYQIVSNVLMVEEGYGPVPYYFELQGDRLTFPSPDGSVAQCQRGSKPPAPSPQQAPTPSQAGSQHAPLVVPGQNWPIYARPAGRPAWNTTDPQTLVYKFAGRWAHTTGNTLSNLYLKPNGSYSDAYEAGYSGTFEDPGGYQTGAWGTAGAQQSGGHWTIQGTLEQGTITLHGNNGSRTVLNYQVYVRNGEYYGDYYFNGKLYTVDYIYR